MPAQTSISQKLVKGAFDTNPKPGLLVPVGSFSQGSKSRSGASVLTGKLGESLDQFLQRMAQERPDLKSQEGLGYGDSAAPLPKVVNRTPLGN